MNKNGNIGLKTIAAATNVSVTTVSRVLRNKGSISEKTRKIILETAEKLNYRPNLLIQGIQTGITGNVGVMVPPFNPYWTQVLKGIHDGLVSQNYAPITLWDKSGPDSKQCEAHMLGQLHRLIDRRIDGVILWPKISELYGSHLDELESRTMPVVTIDHELDFSDSVGSDEFLGTKLVSQHLYELGHRRIGHLAGSSRWTWARLRRQSFEQHLSALPDVLLTTVESDDETVPQAAHELLTSKAKLTAIFACSDWVAFEIYKKAAELNINIPEDISIVGYSDTHKLAQWITPALTTVRQKPFEIGYKAAELLIQQIDTRRAPNRHIKIGCEIKTRQSTRKILS